MKTFWSLEPFHQDNKRLKGMYELLKAISGAKSNITAGFVVTRTENELNLAFNVEAHERFTKYPRELLKKKLVKANASLPDKNIVVYDYPTYSTTKAADKLLELAKKKNAKVIALYTHALTGFKRLLMGSFAETLLHRSKTHLLIVTPECSFSKSVKNILFASDFERHTKDNVLFLLDLAKTLKAKLTILHVGELIHDSTFDGESAEARAYHRNVHTVSQWIDHEANKKGVQCEVKISTEIAPIDELILKEAKKSDADLVATAAKVGPLAALMGGSITRNVVRASTKPVLVLKN
jgi:nucleotide-binding universal stress UspA family protein